VDQFALAALLQAKPGKEKEVEPFLISAQPLASAEVGTTSWFAVRLGGGPVWDLRHLPRRAGAECPPERRDRQGR